MTQAERFRRVTERLDTYPDQVIELQRQLVSRVALGPEVGDRRGRQSRLPGGGAEELGA